MTFCLNTYLESLISCKEITYVITGNYNLQYFLFFHTALLFPILIWFFSGEEYFIQYKNEENGKVRNARFVGITNDASISLRMF